MQKVDLFYKVRYNIPRSKNVEEVNSADYLSDFRREQGNGNKESS